MRKGFFRSELVLVSIALVCITIFGATPAVGEKNTINIGYTCGFTGPAAMEFQRAAELVKGIVDEVNAAGGIHGRQIKIFVADDGNDPARVMGNLKRFRERDNCTVMLLSGTSTANFAGKAWAEKNSVPAICGNAQSDGLLAKPGQKAWWFSTCPHTRHYIGAMGVRARELGHKKVGVECSTLAWGQDGLNMIKKHAPKYGLEVVGVVQAEPKTKDLTIQARTLRDTGAEMVMLVEYAAEKGVWARAMKDIGWDAYVLSMSGGMMADALLAYPAELFEGWEVVLMSDISKPRCKKVWDKYEEIKGKRLEAIDLTGVWDAIHVLLEAVRLSDNPDNPKAIREAFYKIKDLPMAIGREGAKASYAPGKNCTVTPEDVAIGVVKSGKIVGLGK